MVGFPSCKALGDALKTQKQPGLLTLNLTYNSHIGDAGVGALCDGLFVNSVLKVACSCVALVMPLLTSDACSNCIWIIAISVLMQVSNWLNS